MRKHYKKILTGFAILILLVIAFLCGGDAPGLSNYTFKSKENTNIKQVEEIKETKTIKKNDSLYESDFQQKNENKNLKYQEETKIVIKENTEENKQKNDSMLNENPVHVKPENISVTDKELTCTLSVRCDTVLNNIGWLDDKKADILPKDGVIFEKKTVVFYEGESVFNVLMREMKRSKIHLEFENTPLYNSAYIEGVANIYEYDLGELSGWMYKVNGWFPNYGCSLYQLKEGDNVEWVYTCDLGVDVGGEYSKGNGKYNE